MAKLEPTDLLQPKGDITPDWFPTLDTDGVTTLLQAYLDDAYARIPVTIADAASQNIAARAWAMYRATKTVLLRLGNSPAKFKVDNEGEQGIIGEQVKLYQRLSDGFLAEWESITDVEDTGSSVDDVGQGAAANTFVW